MIAIPVVVLGALLAASHDGQLNGDSLEWRTTFVADEEGAERLDFIAPLPRDTELTLPAGSSAITALGGEIVALHLPREAWDSRGTLSIVVRQRVARDEVVHLAPIVSTSAVQRLTLVAGGEAVRFVPDSSLGIEQHLTHAVSRGVTATSRARCDEILGATRSASPAIWTAHLVADGPLAKHGLTGTINTGRPSRRAAIIVAAGFVAVVVGLAAMHRVLDRRAREEHDETVLQAEVARMRQAARNS